MSASRWTPSMDKLLKEWRSQINKRSQEHHKLSAKFEKRHYIFGIPSILLGMGSSIGQFSLISDCDTSTESQSTCDTRITFRVILAVGGLLLTGLSSWATLKKYLQLSEQHKAAADEYEQLSRTIDALVRTPYEDRSDAYSTLTVIQEDFSDICKKSPNLESFGDITVKDSPDTTPRKHGKTPPTPPSPSMSLNGTFDPTTPDVIQDAVLEKILETNCEPELLESGLGNITPRSLNESIKCVSNLRRQSVVPPLKL